MATSARAVLSELARAGHDVTFLEQRGNPALTELLRARGSGALRSFATRFSGIRARTYELPKGWSRTVWVGQEVGTADAVIALPGTPESLLPEISEIASSRLVRFFDESLAVDHPNAVRLVRAGKETNASNVPFGPAVTPQTTSQAQRSSRPLVVAYDNANEPARIAESLAKIDPVLIVTGSADFPDWIYLPEVELPDLYATHRIAIVTGSGSAVANDWATARNLLPLASGCASLSTVSDLAAAFENADFPADFPDEFNATTQANTLIAAVRSRLPVH